MSADKFETGDLVFAKIKGHPHWPATVCHVTFIIFKTGLTIFHVITSPSDAESFGKQRYRVMFFGTAETATLKRADLFNYVKFREKFGVEKKVKWFNKAIDEIKLEAEQRKKQTKRTKNAIKKEVQEGESEPLSPRVRRPNLTLTHGEFILPMKLTWGNGQRSTREEVDSTKREDDDMENRIGAEESVADKYSEDPKNASSKKRSRHLSAVAADSEQTWPFANAVDNFECSTAGHVMLATESDPFLPAENAIEDDHLLLLPDINTKRSRPKRKPRSSRLMVEHMLQEKDESPHSPRRNRVESSSSNFGRTRLMSGFSDVLDDILHMDDDPIQFNPNELMAAIDQLHDDDLIDPVLSPPTSPVNAAVTNIVGSLDDGGETGRTSRALPAPLRRCYHCGLQCELVANKWRCTDPYCLRWNGFERQLDSPKKQIDDSVEVKGWLESQLSGHPLKTGKEHPSGMEEQKVGRKRKRGTADKDKTKLNDKYVPRRKYKKRQKPSADDDPPFQTKSPSGLIFRPFPTARGGGCWTSGKVVGTPPNPPDASLGAVAAAVLHNIGNSMNSASSADMSVDGALDLLMDTFFSSIGPLVSIIGHLEGVVPVQTIGRFLDSHSVHTPKFGYGGGSLR